MIKTKARKPEIVKIAPDEYESGCEKCAQNDKANKAPIKALAVQFGIAESQLKIIHGLSWRPKVIEIMK